MKIEHDYLVKLAENARSWASMAEHHDTTAGEMNREVGEFEEMARDLTERTEMSDPMKKQGSEELETFRDIRKLLSACPEDSKAEIPLLELAYASGKIADELASNAIPQGLGEGLKGMVEAFLKDPKALSQYVSDCGGNPRDSQSLNSDLEQMGIEVRFTCA